MTDFKVGDWVHVPSAGCSGVLTKITPRAAGDSHVELAGPGGSVLHAMQSELRFEHQFATVISLNPDDPFEAALIPIVETNRRKRADYAVDGDPFSNFRGTAEFIGRPAWTSALFNVSQKMERVKSLRANGRADSPANEPLRDTVLDLAVYAVIAWAIYLNDNENG